MVSPLMPSAARAAGERPNIILVMCDDLGWGDVSINGNQVIKTPNLDAMAANGLRFTRFYAGSAVCSPTRGSVVTGRNPYRYGVFFANVGHLRRQEICVAELLKQHGYTTGHFGKWHLGTLTKTIKDSNRGGPRGAAHYSPPWLNGFDRCFSTEAKVPTCDPMWKPKNAGHRYWNCITDKSRAVPYGTHYWNEKGKIVRDDLDGDDSRVIMDRVIPFVQSAASQKKPFLAVVWFHSPHLPVVADATHYAMYSHVKNDYTRNYYGCISAMDDQIGRLRRELKTLGIARNTLVAFCSDNGPEGTAAGAPGSAGPFRGRKRDLFEGGIRVPGVIEWPGVIQPNSVTDYPAVTSDYLPTILDILGIRMPDGRPIDGISLMPVLTGHLSKRTRPIGFQLPGKVALVDNQYKIVRYRKRGKRQGRQTRATRGKQTAEAPFMLFDLLKDPSETTDLARQHPEIVARMRRTLDKWVASCAASNQGEDYPQ